MDIYDDESQGNGEGTGSGAESGVGLLCQSLNAKNEMQNFDEIFENGMSSEWLTTKSASGFLSISETALRIHVHRGNIKSYKFGRRLRFKKQDLVALFKERGR